MPVQPIGPIGPPPGGAGGGGPRPGARPPQQPLNLGSIFRGPGIQPARTPAPGPGMGGIGKGLLEAGRAIGEGFSGPARDAQQQKNRLEQIDKQADKNRELQEIDHQNAYRQEQMSKWNSDIESDKKDVRGNQKVMADMVGSRILAKDSPEYEELLQSFRTSWTHIEREDQEYRRSLAEEAGMTPEEIDSQFPLSAMKSPAPPIDSGERPLGPTGKPLADLRALERGTAEMANLQMNLMLAQKYADSATGSEDQYKTFTQEFKMLQQKSDTMENLAGLLGADEEYVRSFIRAAYSDFTRVGDRYHGLRVQVKVQDPEKVIARALFDANPTFAKLYDLYSDQVNNPEKYEDSSELHQDIVGPVLLAQLGKIIASLDTEVTNMKGGQSEVTLRFKDGTYDTVPGNESSSAMLRAISSRLKRYRASLASQTLLVFPDFKENLAAQYEEFSSKVSAYKKTHGGKLPTVPVLMQMKTDSVSNNSSDFQEILGAIRGDTDMMRLDAPDMSLRIRPPAARSKHPKPFVPSALKALPDPSDFAPLTPPAPSKALLRDQERYKPAEPVETAGFESLSPYPER